MTENQPIQMVDLRGQYRKIKKEIDRAVLGVIDSAAFINGPAVKSFQANLEKYSGAKHVIPCANGTDALQVAMMALGLKPGDEVIVPAFTYVATAEVIALLGLTPVMVDVDPKTFLITPKIFEKAISPKTKAVVPVHLFGQCADVEGLMEIAEKHGIFVIEDNAQAIGADFKMKNGVVKKSGTIGHIGTTSFFPSKNLGCYGDGGAIFTNDDALAANMRMVAHHGESKKYYHAVVGINSRLDTIQAAILEIKLPRLDKYCKARQAVAKAYDKAFRDIKGLQIPARAKNSTHVFHQYTLMVDGGRRDELKAFLEKNGVPAMIYYPVPLYEQLAYAHYFSGKKPLPVTEKLSREVISLPIHTEMSKEVLEKIIGTVRAFFNH